MEKMGTLKKNGDQMGTKKLILVPMGTKVPKWGPMWEQCTWLKYHFTSSTCQELNMGPHGLGEPTGHLICSEVLLHMWKDL